MIIVSTVHEDPTDTKELLEHVQTLGAFRALGHHKLVRDLISSLVASPPSAVGLANEVD